MKKSVVMCLLVLVMALSFTVPVMAISAAGAEVVDVTADYVDADCVEADEGITPFNEQTQFFFRTYGGVLQFRIWSVTNGRWLNDWTNW